MALKLRRAKEKGVIPYPTRATSFKRSLGGALPPLPRAATCPDFVGIPPPPDRRDSYGIGEACAVDLESHSERGNDNRVPFFPIEADVVRTPQLPDGRANPDSFARAKESGLARPSGSCGVRTTSASIGKKGTRLSFPRSE